MTGWFDDLERTLPPGRVRVQVPLSSFTTWRVGGPAEVLVEPETEEQAALAIRAAAAADVACRVLGFGSNVLISDEGVNGVLIHPAQGMDRAEFSGARVTAGAATGLQALARECARRGLAGVEFCIGIPGSVGGAAATNAGAHGSQMADVVAHARVLGRDGSREDWKVGQLGFRYRHSRILENPVFVVSMTLGLREEDPRSVEEETRARLEARRGQPRGRSCGSVFRNPEGDFAGRLLDAVGAKGMRSGGARVPHEHANYILAEGRTSAADILALMNTLQRRVLDETGILLEPEVVFAGFEAGDPRLPKGARILGELQHNE